MELGLHAYVADCLLYRAYARVTPPGPDVNEQMNDFTALDIHSCWCYTSHKVAAYKVLIKNFELTILALAWQLNLLSDWTESLFLLYFIVTLISKRFFSMVPWLT